VVGRSGEVTGLDFAVEQLALAKQRQDADTHAVKVPMRWIEGDALSLPFDSEYFDAITCGYGLRNVADVAQCLSEAHRVLKPGRTAAFLDFNNSTNILVSVFQGAMLDNVVVPVATFFGMTEEYEYLRPSIARFPTGPQLEALGRSVGFQQAAHYEIAGGLMGVLVLSK